jgi:hypothetical protein
MRYHVWQSRISIATYVRLTDDSCYLIPAGLYSLFLIDSR